MKLRKAWCLLVLALCSAGARADAQVRITEWMYDGSNGEFIEITNLGGGPVNLTGWSFDDDSRAAGTFSLSSLGTLAPGESAVITEAAAAAFRTSWSLPASVKVAGSNTTNLGRNDEINIYNGTTLVDRLTFGDQNFAGSIRTQGRSGNPLSAAALGANDPYQWILAALGDEYGSYASVGGQLGNPGVYGAIPEPSSVTLLALGGVLLAGGAWRRRRATRQPS